MYDSVCIHVFLYWIVGGLLSSGALTKTSGFGLVFIFRILLNQVLSIFLMWFTCPYLILPVSEDLIEADNWLLSLLRCGWLILFILLTEVIFYTVHRLLHRYAFDSIHKQHHKFEVPIALAAIYSHPVEHMVCNVIPVLIPPMLFPCSQALFNIWIALATINTLVVHHPASTYKSAGFHELHHLKGSGNYGVFGLMDRVCGTWIGGY